MASILEPGRNPKTDKSAILVDAVRMVTQLRSEAQKLKDSNSDLQEKIKDLKVLIPSNPVVPCVFPFSSIIQVANNGVFLYDILLTLLCSLKRTNYEMKSRD